MPSADPPNATTAAAPGPASSPQRGPEARSPAAAPALRLAEARRRLAALKGFYIHLTVFVLVVGALVLVNMLTGGRWWVVWVFFGWGIGVLAHGAAVSARGSRALAAWEERKLAAYLAEPTAARSGPPGAGRHEPEPPAGAT